MIEAELRRVFARLDIFDVTEVNGWVMAPCPFAPWRHDSGYDKKPSFGFKIEDDQPSFSNCFTCKARGTVSSIVMQLGRLLDDNELSAYGKKLEQEEILGSHNDLGDWEHEAADTKKKEDYRLTRKVPIASFYKYPSVFGSRDALAYLNRRGVLYSTVISTRLRYDDRDQRILFPVFSQTGAYTGCTGRSVLSQREGEERSARTGRPYPKIKDYHGLPKDRVLLARPASGHVHQRRDNRVIIVEGLFAYLRLVQLGFGDCTKALLGSALTPAKEQILRDLNVPIYWFTDNDIAGQSCLYGPYDIEEQKHDLEKGALHKLYNDVPQFVPAWPEGKTDPDELTKLEIETMIEEADIYVKPLTKPKPYGKTKPLL